MTVKELSARTGISVRTLHYYDEIGLLRPRAKSEAGYRLYDDRDLERLRQILFFREFDIPLKDIKALMDNPSLDRNALLQMQRRMLLAKKERLERLITSIDQILKGDERMDFTVFSKSELEGLFQRMFDHMPEELRQASLEEFGGLEPWQNHYLEVMSDPAAQEKLAKMVEWFGGKEEYLRLQELELPRDVLESYARREKAIREKLIQKRGQDLHTFEVKAIIGEYGFVMKQLTQIREEKPLMLGLARSYRQEPVRSSIDGEYGDGAAEFFARAIETFYE